MASTKITSPILALITSLVLRAFHLPVDWIIEGVLATAAGEAGAVEELVEAGVDSASLHVAC